MRDLSLVRVLPDGHLLLTDPQSPNGEQLRLRVDGRLRAALTAAPEGIDQVSIQLSSSLTPREIQARFRAGQQAQEIARLAGVPVERVQRFEPPIRAERDRVAGQAQRAVVSDAADLYTGQPLGALVEEQLRGAAGRRAGTAELTWDAWRRTDGRWVVEVTWGARGRGSAQWLWDPVRLRLSALSAAAEDFSRGRGGTSASARPAAPATAPATPHDPAVGDGAEPDPDVNLAPEPEPVADPGEAPGPAPAAGVPAAASSTGSHPERPRPGSARTGSARTGSPRTGSARPNGSRANSPRRASVPAWSDVLLGTSPRPQEHPGDAAESSTNG